MDSQVKAMAPSAPHFTPVAVGLLQRKCACGQHTVAGGECEECRQKREGMIQRAAVTAAPINAVPPIVHEVLSSSGQPLDASTRTFMEPRFGHDFSQVRLHTDARAAESARAVNALAYTVGQDVVFGEGEYKPETNEGRRLLAHELTHVVQQGESVNNPIGVSSLDEASEREASYTASNILLGQQATIQRQSSFSLLQRQPPGTRRPPDVGRPSSSPVASCPARTEVERTIDLTPAALDRGYRTAYGIAAVMRVQPDASNWDGTHIFERVTERSRTCPVGIVHCEGGERPVSVGDPGHSPLGNQPGLHNRFYDFHRTENRTHSILHEPTRNPTGMSECDVICNQEYLCNSTVIGHHTITRHLRKGTYRGNNVTIVNVTKV